MSQLDLETSTLTLVRYPLSAQETALQAWEAADEYLLRELADMPLGDGPRLIFNDAFGALACGLQAQSPCCISDSYLSQLATRHNLAQNGFDVEGVTLLDSLSDLPASPALVVIKVPKTLALLEHQLRMLSHVVTPQTVVIAGAKARDIHTSTLALFEQILGPTKTSLAWKKARLIHCQPDGREPSDRLPLTEWPVPENGFQIANHANVFARGGLDIGARLFMQHLPQELEGKVVDLGCGNGVVGLTALDLNPQATISFLDESYMAVASSRKNVELNRPQDLDRCEFAVNNSLAGIADGSLQAVLCNPPFHQQQAISGDIAWQMFTDAKRCLSVGGELRIIGNRHLNYFQKLKRMFGNCETIASNPKFVVLRAIKSAAKRR
ncbi:23S rRNA (guanine(1835)-N(2))-methyltransferase RlmG [Lonsdalea britannica]|uniref:23S rRNA (guanine(1835)-N(2))-methyltransferase RlmG n=1 Tax=Lonsdalea britannica TaxID=1082704 RepID=UPI0026E9C243|nr:23S rRNA (guanine(1835)-N(2))-methyltransferase RlmG [Lonsdalea britannica]